MVEIGCRNAQKHLGRTAPAGPDGPAGAVIALISTLSRGEMESLTPTLSQREREFPEEDAR